MFIATPWLIHRTPTPIKQTTNESTEVAPGMLITTPGGYRKARLREAMGGIDYESGRAVIGDVPHTIILQQSTSDAYSVGMTALQNNDRVAAVQSLTHAVILDDKNPDHFIGLARALLISNKIDEAIAALRTALDLDEDSEARVLLAEALSWQGNFAAAIANLETVVTANTDHAHAYSRLAVFRYYTQDNDGARDALDRAIALGAETPQQLPDLLAGRVPRAHVNSLGVAGTAPSVGPQIRIDQGGTRAANETTIIMDDADTPTMVAGWNDYREDNPNGSSGIRLGTAISDDGGQTWVDAIVRPEAQFQSNVEGDPMTAYDARTGHFWIGAISFDSNGGMYVARKTVGATTFGPPVMARISGSADKGWMEAGPDPVTPNQTNLYIAYNEGLIRSTDLGQTWNLPTSLGFGLGFLPRVNADGTVFVIYWNQGTSVLMRRSDDAGNSFVQRTVAPRMYGPFNLGGLGIPGTFRAPFLSHMAIGPNGTLYAVYYDATEINGDEFNFDIYFTKSENDGDSWTTPVVINGDETPHGDQWMPWIEADPNGRLHVMYFDTREGAQDDTADTAFIHVYYSFSDDDGDSWNEIRLTPTPFNSEMDGRNGANAFIGDYQTLAANSRFAMPCYLSNQNGDSDIFVNLIDFAPSLLGDMNCDGIVSVGDIGPFVTALTDPAGYAILFPDCDINNGDLNDDGIVSVGDIGLFVALLVGG